MSLEDRRSFMERMNAGEWYVTDEEILALQRERAGVMEAYNTCSITDMDGRRALLHALFGAVGDNVDVRPPVYVDYGSNVRLGSGTFLNYGCSLADVAPIVLGEQVQVGPYVQLLTPVHPLDATARRERWETAEPITIGDNVWLGGGVIVCPGVSIGPDTVVGAGAVVTKDLPGGVLAVGNPARVVRGAG
ncbi:MAG: sugar O-acetyltransferase [Nocardioidaceae bacterium]|nr:sugar O-acetyltransferase [Nocardioidaceae bacterium]